MEVNVVPQLESLHGEANLPNSSSYLIVFCIYIAYLSPPILHLFFFFCEKHFGVQTIVPYVCETSCSFLVCYYDINNKEMHYFYIRFVYSSVLLFIQELSNYLIKAVMCYISL